MKDWNKIARELSSPEASDAEDEVNVVSVQKNARRVAELLHHMVPGMDPAYRGSAPMGMNSSDAVRLKPPADVNAALERADAASPPAPPTSPAIPASSRDSQTAAAAPAAC